MSQLTLHLSGLSTRVAAVCTTAPTGDFHGGYIPCQSRHVRDALLSVGSQWNTEELDDSRPTVASSMFSMRRTTMTATTSSAFW